MLLNNLCLFLITTKITDHCKFVLVVINKIHDPIGCFLRFTKEYRGPIKS